MPLPTKDQVLEFRELISKANPTRLREMIRSQEDELGCKDQADLLRIASFQVPKHYIHNWTEGFITQHPPLLKQLAMLNRLAYTNDTILLRGPTGVGKEVLARSLNPLRKGEFVGINCAALPATLIESELFGYVKGAFTGAATDKPGLFRQAQDGTLFLDEVFELPRELQAKLLRVLELRLVRPVGGTEEYKINCRIVAATCAHNNNIRPDFYARIRDFEFNIPPLTERIEDIPLIMKTICPEFPLHLLPSFEEPHYTDNVRALIRFSRQWKVFGELL